MVVKALGQQHTNIGENLTYTNRTYVTSTENSDSLESRQQSCSGFTVVFRFIVPEYDLWRIGQLGQGGQETLCMHLVSGEDWGWLLGLFRRGLNYTSYSAVEIRENACFIE